MNTIEHVSNTPVIILNNITQMSETPHIVIDNDIRTAARKRLEEATALEAVRLAEETAKAKAKAEALEATILEEKIRARVEEEKIRRLAEQAVAEAEAKKRAAAREAAIAAEMERLKGRTKVEILEDTIAELRAEIVTLKANAGPQCRR